MKYSKVINVFFVLAGLIGLYVGGSLVFLPATFQAQSNIILGNNISQFSDTRASGLVILVASIIILIGIFRQSWRQLALIISTLIFLSYGLGRLFSLMIDGMPATSLFYAMIAELIIGGIGLVFIRLEKGKILA